MIIQTKILIYSYKNKLAKVNQKSPKNIQRDGGFQRAMVMIRLKCISCEDFKEHLILLLLKYF